MLPGVNTIGVDIKSETITLSKLFDWYAADFGTNNREKLQWIVRQLDANQQAADIEQLLADDKYKIKYAKYDWSLNAI